MTTEVYAPISVIIPTYMRRESLLDVIRDLSNQTVKPSHVFIIDASPKELRVDLVEYLKNLDIEHVPYSAEPNASRQRNLAISKVQTPWILFLDDDVRFDCDLIKNYMAIADENQLVGINGLVKLKKYQKFYNVKIPKARIYQVGGKNFQGSDQIVQTHVICTANFLAQTDPIRCVGGFDEQIAGSVDDVDLGLRLRENGYNIIHHPLPEVLHLQITNSGARSFTNVWSLTNLFYFQYRHFEDPKKVYLLLDTLWRFCHPSRDWLRPKQILCKVQNIVTANKMALSKIKEGPKLLNH